MRRSMRLLASDQPVEVATSRAMSGSAERRAWQPSATSRSTAMAPRSTPTIFAPTHGDGSARAYPTRIARLGVGDGKGRFHLITKRSNDQFNTTIYGFDDRLRGLKGSRTILLINPEDMVRQGLSAGDIVDLIGDAGDDHYRAVNGLTVTPFDLPNGCIGGHYPEMNPLIPLWYHDRDSKTPASKGVPVRIARSA